MEILAAAVFHIRSSAPEFNARYPEGAATIARYITVTAPLTIRLGRLKKYWSCGLPDEQ